MKLESGIRNLPVRAVPDHVAAGEVDVAEERRNNKDLPVAAHRQDPLQVGDCCRHGYLVGDNQLAHHMILVVIQFHDLRDHAIAIRALTKYTVFIDFLSVLLVQQHGDLSVIFR